MQKVIYEGRKGGDTTASDPVETPNNLLSKSYAKLVMAVAEGELAGIPTGQDIYLGGTPILNSSGSANFDGVTWEWRSGTTDQTYISGMPEVSTEFTSGIELTTSVSWTQSFTSSYLDAIRVTIQWPAIQQQKSNGDIVGYNIVYAIDISTDGGAFVQVAQYDTNSQKTNTTYERTHRVDLPTGSSWVVRVRRVTPSQNSSLIADTMYLKSYTEVMDVKMRYPNTALLFLQFDAELFGGTSIPTISVKVKGKIIKIPSNYDPELRVYSGVWDGTFKWAYSNNPAWCLYDLLTNSRFGTGEKITEDMVDKWTLYQVGQYCDVTVPNGLGGTEPRHTCNVYIQQQQDAWQVLRDFVGIYNGMLSWNGTQILATADMPVDVTTVRTYNRGMAVDGTFETATTSEKTVYTYAAVSYDNPDNHYETAVESTNVPSLIQRYKSFSNAQITAFGCTSRGEAQRKGKYTLLTNSLNRMVTFKLGLDGYLPVPGEVFGVADPIIAGASFSGRVHSATLNTVTLDRVSSAKIGDILYINKSDGTGEGRTISAVSDKLITVTANYSEIPQTDLGWYIEASNLKSQLYRTIKVEWDEDTPAFTVVGSQYEDSKYAAIDTGARLEVRPITIVPGSVQAAPGTITVTSYSYIEQTMSVTTMTASWAMVEGASKYEAQWRKDGGDWINVGTIFSNTFDVKGIYSGVYEVRVRCINSMAITSAWTQSDPVTLTGKVGNPPALASFSTLSEVWGIRVLWSYADGSDDALYVELQESNSLDGSNSNELGYQTYPATSYLKTDMLAGVVKYFRGRIIDRSGLMGPWTDWTYGISEYSTDKLLADLVGQLTESQLGQQLLSRIDLIDGSGVGSVNDRIDQAKDELQDQIDNITDALVYDPDKAYFAGDIVRLGNKLYQAQVDVPANTPPPNPAYWEDVGQILEDANGLAARIDLVETEVETLDDKVTYVATSTQQLIAAYRDDDGEGELADALNGWNSAASIRTEQVVRASATEALASQVVTFQAKIDNNTALIQDETTARVDGDSSLASRITTTEASIGSNTAAIQTNATAIANVNGQLSATYTVKLGLTSNGIYYATGFGIGIDNTSGTVQSTFAITADKFIILNSTGTATQTSPFAVSGGQVIINSAVIGDATITFAKITDSLQSSNYSSGATGWRLAKAGGFELNGNVAGSGTLTLANTALAIYYTNGVQAIYLGL